MTTTIYHKSLSYQVLGAAFTVHGVLGNHFVEAVYQRALCLELQDRGFSVEMEKSYPIYYKERFVGNYRTDLVVENIIIIETKVTVLTKDFEGKLLDYLRHSGLKVGYLLNFRAPQLQHKRLVL